LIANLSDPNAPDRYRISFFPYGGGSGHAVTPYAVERKSDDEYYIYVYDSNDPNAFYLAFIVTRSTNSWAYNSMDMPWYGDATSRNIRLRSLAYADSFPKACCVYRGGTRTCQAACSTSWSGAQANLQAEQFTIQFQLDGEGYLLITRSDGQRAGYDPVTGEFIAEISGTVEVPVVTGLGFNVPPAIQIPHEPGMTYGAQVSNRENAYGNFEAEANLSIMGPDYAMYLEGLKIDSPEPILIDPLPDDASVADAARAAVQIEPYETMGVTFDPEADRLTFQNSLVDSETPTMTMVFNNPDGADYALEVGAVGLDHGQSVAMAFSLPTGVFTVENNDTGESNGYQVEVDRLNADGTHDVWESDGVTDGDGVGAIIHVGDDWDGTGEPLIEVNYTPTLPAAFRIYLPLVMRQ